MTREAAFINPENMNWEPIEYREGRCDLLRSLRWSRLLSGRAMNSYGWNSLAVFRSR